MHWFTDVMFKRQKLFLAVVSRYTGSFTFYVIRRFYGNRVIIIAWSWFNSHTHRTRCCFLG